MTMRPSLRWSFVAIGMFLSGCSTDGPADSSDAADAALLDARDARQVGDATPSPSSDGSTSPPESPNCSALTSTTGSLVDAQGNAWTLVQSANNGLEIYENGTYSNLTMNVIELAYVNQVISQENIANNWWSWTNGAWVAESNPTGACSGTVPDAGPPAPGGAVAAPAIVCGSGTQTVWLSTSTPGAGIWYTTDGSTPTLPPGGVPAGTSTGYTPVCNPIAQPPLSNLKNITAYGAVSGGADATTAIENACSAAGTGAGTGIYIPAGKFYHSSGQLTLNCNIYGQGQSSELYCPSSITGATNCEIVTTGSNEVWSNWSHVIVSSARDSFNFNIHIVGGSNNRMDTLFLNGGNAGGFFNDTTSGEIDTNNGVINTLADANYHTTGSTNDTVDHTYVYNSGDDSDSNISYAGESGGPVNGSLVQWNNLRFNAYARGASISGENMTVQDNLIQNISGAGIYIAQEPPSSYDLSPVSNIITRYNYLLNDDITATQDCIMLYAGQSGSGNGITNVQVLGNYIANCHSPSLAIVASPGTVSDVSFTNNTITGTTAAWNVSGPTTNIGCSGNTYNGSPTSVSQCATNPDTATGSPVTYSGCVVGTAHQYTGPITVNSSATVEAIAVFPGLTNSSVASKTCN
jgi:hypothetical protein